MGSKLVSIAEYALLCGITRQAVYDRIKSGRLKIVRMKFGKCINIDKFPPTKAHYPVGRPTVQQLIANK